MRLVIRETARVSPYPAPTSLPNNANMSKWPTEKLTQWAKDHETHYLPPIYRAKAHFQRTSTCRVICYIANSDNMMPVGNV